MLSLHGPFIKLMNNVCMIWICYNRLDHFSWYLWSSIVEYKEFTVFLVELLIAGLTFDMCRRFFSLWWRNLLIWNIKLFVVYRAVNLNGCKCFLVNTKEFPKTFFFRMWLCEVVSSNSDKVSLYGRKIWIWFQDVQACDFCFPGYCNLQDCEH